MNTSLQFTAGNLFWPVRVADFSGADGAGQSLVYELTNIGSDAQQIVVTMADLAKQYGIKPEIRDYAEKLLPEVLAPDDQEAQLAAVVNFIQNRMNYVRDPQGVEFIKTPERLLTDICSYGFAYGDCDDHVVLLNTLLNAIGFSTAVVALKVNGSNDYNHVISSVTVKGKPIDIDLCTAGDPYNQYTGARIVADSTP